MSNLQAGAAAPEFTAVTDSGATLRLSELRGKRVVLYFYPKDDTPGCTKEACAFRDAWAKFQTQKVGIVGVSRDSEESHRVFVKKHDLPFPLAADENGEIARSYGVKSTLGVSSRVTFLVTADGKIAKIWPDVDPGIHADEVLAAAAALPSPP